MKRLLTILVLFTTVALGQQPVTQKPPAKKVEPLIEFDTMATSIPIVLLKGRVLIHCADETKSLSAPFGTDLSACGERGIVIEVSGVKAECKGCDPPTIISNVAEGTPPIKIGCSEAPTNWNVYWHLRDKDAGCQNERIAALEARVKELEARLAKLEATSNNSSATSENATFMCYDTESRTFKPCEALRKVVKP